MRIFAALAIVMLGLMAAPAIADQEKVAILQPTKERLIVFWEDTLKSDPQVKKLEKTKEEGVYNFETTFFPYKGRLRLLNAAITPYEDGYYDGLSSGIIEVELLDADEKFFKKYAASYSAWTRQNYFYHDEVGGVWFPANKMGDWSKEYYKRNNPAAATPAAGCASTWWTRNMTTLVYIVFLAALVGFVVLLAKKQNKKIWDNHATALSEQQRGLAMVEKSMALTEQSLKHQQEMIRLLTEILKK
ncbi:MAG: hypothetical protein ACAH80_09460 [Alphaproteobacteria bacterium]